MLAVPVLSVVVVPVSESTSGAPGAEVMMRTSPEITSKRTVRPTSGTPAWESTTFTSASPPEQIAVPHAVDWLALGVTVTTLLTVRGFTMRLAVAGVFVPEVSCTVSVTGVSDPTSFGMTVIAPLAAVPTTGSAC